MLRIQRSLDRNFELQPIDIYVAIEPIFLRDNADYSQEVQLAREVLLHPGEGNNV